MAWMCPRCGCRTYHHNRSRMCNVCDGCGTPVADPQQEAERQRYDRTLANAQAHLQAGNWSQTISLLRPLQDQNPTDKRVYRLILRAATKDFSDLEMTDSSTRAAASQAWEKLIRLNGADGATTRYARRRYEKHREALRARKGLLLLWIFLAAGCSLLTSLCFGTEHYFTGLLCLGGLVGCLYCAIALQPLTLLKELAAPPPDPTQDPFLSGGAP